MGRFPILLLLTFLVIFQHNASASTDLGLPTFPSLSQFQTLSTGEVTGDFSVSQGCTATVGKVDTTFKASFTPANCLNLGVLLDVISPGSKDNIHMDSNFMVMDNIIIRSLAFDKTTGKVDIAASYASPIYVIPDTLSISDIMMEISFFASNSGQWTFDLTGTITIGSVSIETNLVRNEQGYFMTASAKSEETAITLTDIASMFHTSDSILPKDGLDDEMAQANLDSFSIAAPRIKAVFTDGYGVLFGGKVTLPGWEPTNVNVLINKPSDGVQSVTIAVHSPSFSIAKLFQDLFKMDISSVPVVGTALIKNLVLIISTQTVETPLTPLDIADQSMFETPYERGVKVTCDLQISGKSVSLSLSVTDALLSLTITNPGGLTLRNIVDDFLSSDSSEIISNDNADGGTALKSWPKFITFDPLAIALSNLALEVDKNNTEWSMNKLDIKLVMTEPIVFFDNVITIKDLSFEMSWSKTGEESQVSGIIKGTVTIGQEQAGKIPTAAVNIPFPFPNQEISITFTDFSINSIAAAFDFQIPQDSFLSFLTQIQLDSVKLGFGNTSKLRSISVDCSLPTTWPIFGSISIGNLGLSVQLNNLDEDPSAREWKFVITGHVIISSCDIKISSTIGDSSIKIEGSGPNCAVSISDLLNAISVDPSSLPDTISGFTLSAPAALFDLDRTTSNKAIGFAATTSLFGSSDVEVVFKSTGATSAIVVAFAAESASSVPEISFLSSLGLTNVAVMYVSNPVTLEPYTWRKDIFNKYASVTEELSRGLTIKAKFEPSAETMVGKLLTKAGKASVDVSLTIPELKFELKIEMPNGGIALSEGSSGKFVSMSLILSKELIGLNLKFSLEMDNANLTFTGSLSFTFGGTVSISLLMEGRWDQPFGIQGFAINKLGLELGINVVTLLPKFGFTGEIEVTPVALSPITAGLTICVDASNPSSLVLDIHFTRLLLEDIANLFMNRNVGLPEQIGKMGFYDQVRIFFSPVGTTCFEKTYEAGVEIHGGFRIPFLQIDARADIVVKLSPFQLKADLQLGPINYGDGLLMIVSAESDTEGAFLKMNIGNADEFLIDGSCKIKLFGASASIRLTINKEKLYFRAELVLWTFFRASLEVELIYGGANPSLRVKGEMQNDLFTRLKRIACDGISAAARAISEPIEAGRRKLENARREVNKLKDNIAWHQQQINNAKRECSSAPWYRKWVCIGSGARIVYHYAVIGGIHVAVGVANGVLSLADLFLQGLLGVIKIGEAILTKLVQAALSIIDIQYIRFDVFLSGPQQTIDFEARVVVLGWTFSPSFTINFSSSDTVNSGLSSAGNEISSDTMSKVKK